MTPLQRTVAADYGFAASFEDRSIPAVKTKNFWIILEGEDGVGKTTLANALKHLLSLQDPKCIVEAFGKHFVHEETATNDMLWMRFVAEFGSRMPSLQELFEDGWSIIQDRSFLSTIVYQNDWYRVALVMDALFHQWNSAPTHIFVLPPYGRYSVFRDVKRLVLPVSGREIYLVFVPSELNRLEDRINFVLSVLKHGLTYEEVDEDAERNVDTVLSDTEDGTGGDADGEGVETGRGLGEPQFSPTAAQLTNDTFATITRRTEPSYKEVAATTADYLGGVADE